MAFSIRHDRIVAIDALSDQTRLAQLDLAILDDQQHWTPDDPAPASLTGQTAVMNLFSELIIDLHGTDAGSHALTAIGVAAIALNLPVVISAEAVIVAPKHWRTLIRATA
jgi:hypothetical protein